MSTTQPPRRRMGRPPQVDAAVIVSTARAIGFDVLTMTSLGKHLGVSHSALYSYFCNRDELVSAVIADIFADCEWPRLETSWRPFLGSCVAQLWDVLDANRGLAFELDSARPGLPAGYDVFIGHVRGGLLDAGFSPLNAIMAAEMAVDQALAFHKFTRDATGRSLTVGEYRSQLRERAPESLRGVDERGRAGLLEMLEYSPRDWFLRKLDVLLDGIERRCIDVTAPPPPPVA